MESTMSLQTKGNAGLNPSITETRTFDSSYLTGWTELGNFTGYQVKLDYAGFGGTEAEYKAGIKRFVMEVSPNWFLLNGADGTNAILMLIVENRWSADALKVVIENIMAGTYTFESWTGYWHSDAQKGMSDIETWADNDGGDLNDIRKTAPAGFDRTNLRDAIDYAHEARYATHEVASRDGALLEGVSSYPARLGDYESNSVMLRVEGRRSLSRTEALEYDVIYNQGTDAGYLSIISIDLDGFVIESGNAGQAKLNIAQADIPGVHERGGLVDLLIGEMTPLAYTVNHNGDRLNSAGLDSGAFAAYAMADDYDLVMLMDRPISEVISMLKRIRSITEEDVFTNDDGAILAAVTTQANSDRLWSRTAKPTDAANTARSWNDANIRINCTNGDFNNDVRMHMFPGYFCDTSGY